MERIEKSKINISRNGIVVDIPEDLKQTKHSEEVYEIITKVPKWIVRWGITLFFGILLITVAVTSVIRYPDTIKSELQIESVNPSRSVVNEKAGTISKILVKKGQTVEYGHVLAYIKNSEGQTMPSVLTAPQGGRVSFVAIVQEGYLLKANQEVFRISPEDERYFGIIKVPQNKINKILIGQEVAIELNNYPIQEYGQLKGRISYIVDEPMKDGTFTAKVDFDNYTDRKKLIKLKPWMAGTAKIITENVSIQRRIYNSIVKGLK